MRKFYNARQADRMGLRGDLQGWGVFATFATMAKRFNAYIDGIDPDFWRDLCVREGELRQYRKGEEFATAGTTARFLGYIKSGTLKYVAYADDGTPHVVGLEFAGEFVADFPFSLYRQKARCTIVAESDCEIYCLAAESVREMMDTDSRIKEIAMHSTESVFATVYDRYLALYCQSPQQRYLDLISRHPDLFALFSLKDIASFLNITPTHLSRLRKNI